jgi:hypothetical protein
MPEPAAPFAVDPGTAAHALVPAESAARNVLDLRPDPSAGDLDLAAFGVAAGETSDVDASDARAVLDHVDWLFVAEHGSPGASATVRPAAGAGPHPGS